MHLSIHNKEGKDAYKMDHRNLDAFVLLFEDYLQKCDKGKMEVLGHIHAHTRIKGIWNRDRIVCVF